MNGLEILPAWAAIIVIFMLVLGGSIVLIGALGLMRLPTFYQRIHGPAITITLGAGALLIASMVYFTVSQSRLVVHELLITLFVMMTAPVVSMLLMRVAVYRDLRGRKGGLVGEGNVYRQPPDETGEKAEGKTEQE